MRLWLRLFSLVFLLGLLCSVAVAALGFWGWGPQHDDFPFEQGLLDPRPTDALEAIELPAVPPPPPLPLTLVEILGPWAVHAAMTDCPSGTPTSYLNWCLRAAGALYTRSEYHEVLSLIDSHAQMLGTTVVKEDQPNTYSAGTQNFGDAVALEVPNSADPTTDAFGEIAGDNNAWGTGRGAFEFFDGTSSVWLPGILASDTCGNGQVPKFNTGGTWTCEDDATGGAGSGDPVLVDGSAIGDASGVNLIGGAGIDYTLNTGVSPDTATAAIDTTEMHDQTFGDDTDPVIGWTFNQNTGTDPVIQFDGGTVNVSTGTLQQGGVNVVTTTGGQTLTNKTLTTPIITGKVDHNNVSVDDDDCTGEQGLSWYDTLDAAHEFCDANSGTPKVVGGGGGAGSVTSFSADAQRFSVANANSTPALSTKTTNALGSITGSTTVNWNNGVVQTATLTGETTLSFSNPVNGQVYTLILTQDGTGDHVVTWPTVTWVNNAAPPTSHDQDITTLYQLTYNGSAYTGVWYPAPFEETEDWPLQAAYNAGKQIILSGAGLADGVKICRDVDSNGICATDGTGGDRTLTISDDAALGTQITVTPDADARFSAPSGFDLIFRLGGIEVGRWNHTGSKLEFSGAARPLKSVEVQGHEFGAVTYAEAALASGKPVTGYFTATNVNTDGFDFDFVTPLNWNAGTVTVQLRAAHVGATPGNSLVFQCGGQAVSDNDVVGARSTANEALVTISFVSAAQYSEQHATSGAITINGSPAAGDHLYMHCEIDATNGATMANVRINAMVKVFYTVTSTSE